MNTNPYVGFDGRCAEALKVYEELLGAKVEFSMTWGDSPMAEQTPEDWRGKIMHATLRVGESVIMAADAPPGRYEKPQGMSLSINLKDIAVAERVFAGLAEGGTVEMPLQETFWAARFGMLTDRFSVPWMVNCEKPNTE